MIRRPPRSTLFPTRRSSDLLLPREALRGGEDVRGTRVHDRSEGLEPEADHGEDRKSTRLNSSHSQISYAVFCLKKKKSKTKNLIPYAKILIVSDILHSSP